MNDNNYEHNYEEAYKDKGGFNLCRNCWKPVGKPEHRNADKHFNFRTHKACAGRLLMK